MAKKRKRKLKVKNLLILLLILAVLIGLIVLLVTKLFGNKAPAPASSAEPSSEQIPETSPEPTPTPTAEPTPTPTPEPGETGGVLKEEFTDTDSLLLLANKKHRLPEGYAPEDLAYTEVPTADSQVVMRYEAAVALENMCAAAYEEGITLVPASGFRSEELQAELYNGYVEQYGTERADRISSRPGYSDHQTGLAADIADHDWSTVFTQDMENTPEGIWLKDHAHEYGFIMRYPKGKEEITGYAYEPWHFRYIGVEAATAIWSVDPFYTFEEYYGVSGGDYAD